MKQIQLEVEGALVPVEIDRVIIAGFTGRNREAVQHHIRELEAHGVPAPATVPAFYDVPAGQLSTASSIDVNSDSVSGEAEAVLIFPGDDLESALVTVGSDLTDRVMERESILRAKQFPKPIGRRAWRMRDIVDAWDDLRLTSWTEAGSDRRYQQGTLASLLKPQDVIAAMPADLRSHLANSAIFLGTIPLCEPKFAFVDYFRCELSRDGDALFCEYTVSRPA